MTPDEYITLAGKYCERMEWNHDAIPELAKCLEQHDLMVVLKFARRTMDKQAELERENERLQMELDASCNAEELRQVRAENARLRDAGWSVAKALGCARGHGYHGGGPALAEWAAYFPKSDSALPNACSQRSEPEAQARRTDSESDSL